MKKGWVMALTGVSLFAGTVTWSAFKKVSAYGKTVSNIELGKNKPDHQERARLFFDTQAPYSISVEAPVEVELVPGFNGVELLGDTSLMRTLNVSTGWSNGATSVDIGVYRLEEDGSTNLYQTDSPEWIALREAHIVVRIGLGDDDSRQWEHRDLTFTGCSRVKTSSPLKATDMYLSFFKTDSAQVNVQVDNLYVYFLSQAFKSTDLIKLEGHCDRILVERLVGGTFDATALDARDFYIQRLKDANVRIRASRLAHGRDIENCKIEVEGNPTFKKIEER